MGASLPFFDYLKGLLILLVVLGHCIERSFDFGFLHDLNTVLYTFRMPLFVMISGYFSKKRESIKEVTKNMLPLFVVYVIFNTLHILMDGNSQTVLQSIIVPGWTMWFILSLIFWNYIDYIIPAKWSNDARGIVVSFALSFLVGFIPFTLELSLQRTFTFLPFFFIGKYLRTKGFQCFGLINKILASGVIVIISIFMVSISTTGTRHIIYGTDTLYGYAKHLYTAVAFKILFYVITIAMSFSIASILPKKMPSVLTVIGRHTLFIYMYHSVLILIVMRYMDVMSPWGCASLFGIICLALFTVNHIPVFRCLTDTRKIKNILGYE